MREFNFMGREIKVTGEGAPDSPFVITGTGFNPSLVAEIETHFTNLCFENRPWHLMKTRSEREESGRRLAILTVRYFSAEDEILESDVWFDVTEAFTRHI